MGNDATSIEIFSRGTELLAEANTVQKAKDLKNLALTAADWARRKDMGNEAIQLCRGYALEAERKMGEMLAATERATGAKGVGKSAVTTGNRTKFDEKPPSLNELGLTKRESSAAQKLASLPSAVFEQVKSGKKTRIAAAHNVETFYDTKPEVAKSKDKKTPEAEIFYDDPKPSKETESKPAAKDQAGQSIKSPELATIFGRRHEITELMTSISRIKSTVMNAADKKDQLYRQITVSQFQADCANIHRTLRFSMPHAVCPVCGGDGGLNKTCKACRGCGWLTEKQYEVVPAEMKV